MNFAYEGSQKHLRGVDSKHCSFRVVCPTHANGCPDDCSEKSHDVHLNRDGLLVFMRRPLFNIIKNLRK